MSVNTNTHQQLTLLVVAQKNELLNLIQAILTVEGHHVLLAGDEIEGLAMAKRAQPDVILATSGVHQIGATLCQQVRQDAETADIPFIILTTSESRKTYSTYFANGCDQVLPVPFKCADIYTAIHNARKRNQCHNNATIQVLFRSGFADFVTAEALDKLLSGREILCFRRSSGVAVVGRDPIRGSNQGNYSGPERRLVFF